MATYTYTQAVNLDALTMEINAAGLPLAYLVLDGADSLTVVTTSDLTSDQVSSLNAIVSGHSADSLTPANDLALAIAFGLSIIHNFTVNNIANGITQAGMTQTIADACVNLNYYLSTGSLTAAISEIQALNSNSSLPSWSPFITTPILQTYMNQLQTFMGLPNTTL